MVSKQMKKKLSLEGRLHKPTSKEFEIIMHKEHKMPHCGYLRNFYVSKDHNIIQGTCALLNNTKICPYSNYNAKVFNCEIYNKYFGFKK